MFTILKNQVTCGMSKSIFLFIVIGLNSISVYGQSLKQFEVKEFTDLLYVDEDFVENDSLQRLNLVVPITEEKCPLLIWIGGGAWSYVDRNQEKDLAQKIGAQGIAVASIGHRLSPAVWKDPALTKGVQHPKHIEDVATSIKWLYDQALEYGYDAENIFIGGFSSGGHLAALIALDTTYLSDVGISQSAIRGIIPISGTYDVSNYHEAFANGSRPELAEQHVEAVFGQTEDDLSRASPTSYLQNLSTPMLLMSDNKVAHYTQLFEDRILETEFRDIQVVYSYDLSHGDLWRDISLSDHSPNRAVIVQFIWSHLKTV